MSAAIGTGGIPRPNRALVSASPQLRLRDLPVWGKTAEMYAGASLTRVSVTAAGVLIETAGVEVRVSLRYWPMPIGRGGEHGSRRRFACPRCGSSRDTLHWAGEWGCRGKDCLDLEHACRHQQRWCPAIRRRQKLLRKLSRVPSRSLKAKRLRKMIVREQRAMIANLKRANHDLAKRSERYDRQRQRRASPAE